MENRATVVPFKPPQARGAPDHAEAMRIAEALLFASAEPLSSQELAARLPEGGDIEAVLADLVEPRKLSRAAMETLAIVAYHQPVTRAEIEEIRGVATSKGTLDTLLETGWVRLRGRRRAPGRPVTYGTTPVFLDHFGLDAIADLPGLEELKGAGLVEGRIPPGLSFPTPSDDAALREDEDPLDDDLFAPLVPE